VAERRGFAKYKVLDDVYQDLPLEERERLAKQEPKFASFLFGKNPKPQDYCRDLAPWESNARCLRSIKYHHKKGSKSKFKFTTLPQQAICQSRNKSAVMSSFRSEGKEKTVGQSETAKEQSRAKSNTLIDEKSLKTRKARLSKEQELKKHMSTLQKLKLKLAKQIVDKGVKIEEF